MEYVDGVELYNEKLHTVTCSSECHQIGGVWLSKRIEEASKLQLKLFDVVPYIDSKILTNSKNKTKLDEKSDVYSVCVLLWEISSGTPSFYKKTNNIDLIYEITQGQRETIVPDTPNNYANIYTGITTVNW
ncbi:hypothetical protein C1645_835224 [Glomus cerebriforme]|uniref:Serine-threonine/tyrosine-protein kinase catalytic domain-containing protein n=1 Tax=Glomus cerebriforme TaxID=658196 RepID=A0A397SEX3_9GLOM|nr:hypothetical protein C1645_835224 [Glomus cerebriforme]